MLFYGMQRMVTDLITAETTPFPWNSSDRINRLPVYNGGIEICMKFGITEYIDCAHFLPCHDNAAGCGIMYTVDVVIRRKKGE